MGKPRRMSSRKASHVNKQGHKEEQKLADFLGRDSYGGVDKKDNLDKDGEIHSLKAGLKRSQWFLLSRNTLREGEPWACLNGLGQIMGAASDAVTQTATYDEYKTHKSPKRIAAKKALAGRMRQLLRKLEGTDIPAGPARSRHRLRRIKAILSGAIFRGNECTYLTWKDRDSGEYHIYHRDNVLDVLSKNVVLRNSKARSAMEDDDQKVIFDYPHPNPKRLPWAGIEIEIRTSTKGHYGRVLCVSTMSRIIAQLNAHFPAVDSIELTNHQGETAVFHRHGKAAKTFGRWRSKRK